MVRCTYFNKMQQRLLLIVLVLMIHVIKGENEEAKLEQDIEGVPMVTTSAPMITTNEDELQTKPTASSEEESLTIPTTSSEEESLKTAYAKDHSESETDGLTSLLNKTYSENLTMSQTNTTVAGDTNTTLSDTTDTNSTVNATQTHRWSCKPFRTINDSTANTTSVVIMNNETLILQHFDQMNASNGCGLVLFYSPFCEFSVELAPLFNAVGRSYPNLSIIAVDAQEAMGMSARYGVAAIPTVFFFYSGKAVAKFNRSRTSENFAVFIKDMSGFEPGIPINVTELDHIGPVVTAMVDSVDYYMVFSVTFLLIFAIQRIFGSFLWKRLHDFAEYMASKFKREKID